ncbi:DMT family transporter [Natrialba swarupiae]|uniref:DMT family transporter n=1 Tax=Natrialba swarupiae TaxID=2448032 RepID=A0A5D5AHQ2_9EURY|nr:GRP family sugar transporter [Natrialba swarupiae]TYT60357.1 DMT family transporter [Natrialba swarupiae]
MFEDQSVLLGAILASIASLMFAFQYIFVRQGTQKGTVSDIIWISLLSNVVILVPPALLLYDFSMTIMSVLAFMGAGLSGSLFARICMFTSIKRLGASRTSPIVASNALFATVLAVLVLDESLTLVHLFGVILIVAGVTLISYDTAEGKRVNLTRRELAILFFVPILAAVFLGIEPIFISLALEAGGSIIPGTAIVVTTAFVGFTAYTGGTTGLPSPSLVRKPYFKWYIAAGVATTFGLLAAFSAIQIAPVAIAVPLIQTSPLLVIVLSMLFLSSKLEKVTPVVLVSTVIIIVGATIVTLVG